MGDHLVGCSSYTTPEFPAWNSIGMLRPRSIKSLTLEGILKLLCKQWFRRLTSSHNYVFLRLLLRKIFSHNLCMLCCSSRKFGTTRILFSSISLGALALSSLLRTLLVLVLPQAASMQGECLGTNQTDIMAKPASPTTWPGLTLHTYRLFIHVQTWLSQIPSLDKELQCVLTYHIDS